MTHLISSGSVSFSNQHAAPAHATNWTAQVFDAIASRNFQTVEALVGNGTGVTSVDMKKFIAAADKLVDKQSMKLALMQSFRASPEEKLALAVNELNDLALTIHCLNEGADPRKVHLHSDHPFINRELTRVLHTIMLYPSKTRSGGETELDSALRKRDYAQAGAMLRSMKENIEDHDAARELWKTAEKGKQHDVIRAMIALGIAERAGLRLSANSPIKNAAITEILQELDKRRCHTPRHGEQPQSYLRKNSDDSAVHGNVSYVAGPVR